MFEYIEALGTRYCSCMWLCSVLCVYTVHRCLLFIYIVSLLMSSFAALQTSIILNDGTSIDIELLFKEALHMKESWKLKARIKPLLFYNHPGRWEKLNMNINLAYLTNWIYTREKLRQSSYIFNMPNIRCQCCIARGYYKLYNTYIHIILFDLYSWIGFWFWKYTVRTIYNSTDKRFPPPKKKSCSLCVKCV